MAAKVTLFRNTKIKYFYTLKSNGTLRKHRSVLGTRFASLRKGCRAPQLSRLASKRDCQWRRRSWQRYEGTQLGLTLHRPGKKVKDALSLCPTHPDFGVLK